MNRLLLSLIFTLSGCSAMADDRKALVGVWSFASPSLGPESVGCTSDT
jgi:hypothetical protein